MAVTSTSGGRRPLWPRIRRIWATAEGAPNLGGLVLIGTSHPRDFSLADLTLPVVKILGTRDCVAEIAKSEAIATSSRRRHAGSRSRAAITRRSGGTASSPATVGPRSIGRSSRRRPWRRSCTCWPRLG